MKEPVVYQPGQGNIQTAINAQGNCMYSKTPISAQERLDEANLKREEGSPEFELMELDRACEMIELVDTAKYVKEWKETTEEDFWEMLEVLPPIRWKTCRGVEIFQMCEMLTSNITGTYARLGERYFCANRRTTDSHELIAGQVAAFAA